MNIQDLFEKLSHGPLSNLAASGEGRGFIEEQRQPMVVSHANDALIKLFTRFVLMEKDILVKMHMGITNYHLIRKYARWNMESDVPFERRYILDMPEEPFMEDVVKILEVRNSNNATLPIDDRESQWSVFTPQAKILTVPNPTIGSALWVHYQALHPKLSMEDLDAEIFLPEVLHEAMLAYIGYKWFSGIDSETSNAKAQEHLANFNGICTEVIDNDLVTKDPVGTTNTRFGKRGFV